MTGPQEVEHYAQERMARGEVLTWYYDAQCGEATFYVPDDVQVGTFPENIDGIHIRVRKLPRPLSQREGVA